MKIIYWIHPPWKTETQSENKLERKLNNSLRKKYNSLSRKTTHKLKYKIRSYNISKPTHINTSESVWKLKVTNLKKPPSFLTQNHTMHWYLEHSPNLPRITDPELWLSYRRRYTSSSISNIPRKRLQSPHSSVPIWIINFMVTLTLKILPNPPQDFVQYLVFR